MSEGNQENRLKWLLHRAIVELSYCHSAEHISQVESAEGLRIVEEGMRILGLKDLSQEPKLAAVDVAKEE